ncbi:biogenesis of lysosome-related organelles complex 1 subunit 5-like [Saccostrea echinata]|uniref:biogenesis of lysosome-related organelles complex 1 subunit 5-like n=1 Tax=Saccostrea echinata TaxID=191078 RepID=UPI002A803CC7|nr:biogenesis of lysosome-related organelles complex 1 subunit 5-like [Saccostrea echinata]
MDQQLFKDLSEIHARLFDHRPILQGHTNFFVKEFEEKRGNHEQERLKKLDEEIKEMKDGLIPEAKEGMDQFLANITAKLKVATEVCKRVEEKENNIDTDLLEKERERRKSDWTEFLARQYETCDQVDAEFSEQADIVAKHYEELEKNLVAMNNSTP